MRFLCSKLRNLGCICFPLAYFPLWQFQFSYLSDNIVPPSLSDMLSRAFCDEKVELLTLFSGSFLRDSWSSHISPSPRLSLYLSSAEKHPSLSLTFSLPPLRFFPLSISVCLSQHPSSSLLSPLSRSRQLQQRSVCLHWRSSVRLWADWILSHFNPTEQVLNEGGDEERRERITGTQANHKPPLSLSRFFFKTSSYSSSL